jgi:hypothetical protein
MRKRVRKRVRRREDGINVAADVDASIAVNSGASRTQSVRTTSRRRVVQRPPRTASEPARNDESDTKEER